MKQSTRRADLGGSGRGFGWIARRIGLLAVLVLGVAALPELVHSEPKEIEVLEQTPQGTSFKEVQLKPGEEATFVSYLSARPDQNMFVRYDVVVTTGDQVVKYLDQNGVEVDEYYRVFTPWNYKVGYQITIRAVGAGRVWLRSQIAAEGMTYQNPNRFSNILSYNMVETDDIMVKEHMDHEWTPLVMVNNVYSPFDHSMGESEHLTYEVKLKDAAACPATVEVRGRPRFYLSGEYSNNRRIGVVAGSVPPPRSEHVSMAEISATVDFSADDCLNDRAKTFTVYGITDYQRTDSRGSYVSLRHTLINRAGAAVYEQGPKLNVWTEDRYWVLASAAVPPKASETTPTVTRTIHKAERNATIEYVNGVGPADRAGKGIRLPNTKPTSSPWPDAMEIGELSHVLLPSPTSGGDGWVEFCIYIHGAERSLADDKRYGKGDDVIHKYFSGWRTIGLKALTPIPFEFEQIYWWSSTLSREWPHAPKRQLTDRVNKHYRYPIEMQLYTEALNGHSQCNLAGTFTADYDASKWQTIYSGGPRTLDSDGKPSAWTDPATTYSLPQSQWGKLMNVRMRAVYGLPIAGVTDVNHDMTPTTVTVGGTTYSYRPPSGTMLLNFTYAEMLGSESQAGIAVRFD